MEKKSRHKVNFTALADVEAVCLAQLGLSNKAIHRSVPTLSDCQLNYRLRKAKDAEGLPKGHGYRSQWRDGTSPIAQAVASEIMPSLRKHAKEELPKHFLPHKQVQGVDSHKG